jgi:thiol-disulfide isomerase/thioredoxin
MEAFISRITAEGPPAKRPPHIWLELPVRPMILLLSALLLTSACDRQKTDAPQGSPAGEPGAVKGVDRSHKGEAAPDAVVKDPDGGDIDLAEFAGAPVLVNLWASWCAPCVKELPTLDRLKIAQEDRPGKDALRVIAVSQDMGPQNSVHAFLDAHDIVYLDAYHDPDMKLTSALNVQVMPTSVLYDKNGHEVWRYIGDLDWTGAEAKALLAEAG